MDDLPNSQPEPEPPNLRFLRRLVTVLTAVMILGMVTVVVLLALRINQPAPSLTLPDIITLPEGATATVFAAGDGWYAVGTDQNELLIYDGSGALQRTIPIETE